MFDDVGAHEAKVFVLKLCDEDDARMWLVAYRPTECMFLADYSFVASHAVQVADLVGDCGEPRFRVGVHGDHFCPMLR